MKKIGKKGRTWIKASKKIILDALISGRITITNKVITGRCQICKEWKYLELDHIVSRARGGSNDPDNIQFICRECHNKKHSMNKKEKKDKLKKSFSNIKHKCISCGQQVYFLLCEKCGKLSVKR